MIPKIIHYIWFGDNPYPEKVQYCIDSWKKHLPDYQFILWNEDSFDVNTTIFTRQAFENKKWAFISDYVRIYALYNYGGWYLDTDVEIIRSLDSLSNNRIVLGTDEDGALTALMGSEKGHNYWEKILKHYEKMQFVLPDGSFNTIVNNTYLEDILQNYGYVKKNQYQELSDGIVIYPDDYFHVVSLMKGEKHQTQNTYAIHWHTLLWVPKKTHILRYIRIHFIVPILGGDKALNLVRYIRSIWKNK